MIDSKNGFIFILTLSVVFIFYHVTSDYEIAYGEFRFWNQSLEIFKVPKNSPAQFAKLNESARRSAVASTPLHVQRRFRMPVNCSSIVDEKNNEEIAKAEMITKLYRDYRDKRVKDESFISREFLEDLKMIPDENYIFYESRCDEFISTRGYYNYTVTDEEKAFPLAYSFRTYEHAEQFERLLHAVYRPQNVYCVHVDNKSDPKFHEAIKSITRCFPNVFIATNLVRVYWGGHGLLMADISCMKDLVTSSFHLNSSMDDETRARVNNLTSHENLKGKRINNGWKYLLNLASTEFPIRTNRELVQILNIYNGTNDIPLAKFPSIFKYRYTHQWKPNSRDDALVKTNVPKPPPPHNYTMYKSIVFSAFSKSFAEYALKSPEARDLLEWLGDTCISDESYWGTLQFNLQFKPPGSVEKLPTADPIPHMSRFMGWPSRYQCAKTGRRRHQICMITNGDLNHITRQPDFFVNKFQLIDDPVAYACMEDWYARRHQRENELSQQGVQPIINMTPYCKFLYKISSGKIYKGCEMYIDKNMSRPGVYLNYK